MSSYWTMADNSCRASSNALPMRCVSLNRRQIRTSRKRTAWPNGLCKLPNSSSTWMTLRWVYWIIERLLTAQSVFRLQWLWWGAYWPHMIAGRRRTIVTAWPSRCRYSQVRPRSEIDIQTLLRQTSWCARVTTTVNRRSDSPETRQREAMVSVEHCRSTRPDQPVVGLHRANWYWCELSAKPTAPTGCTSRWCRARWRVGGDCGHPRWARCATWACCPGGSNRAAFEAHDMWATRSSTCAFRPITWLMWLSDQSPDQRDCNFFRIITYIMFWLIVSNFTNKWTVIIMRTDIISFEL